MGATTYGTVPGAHPGATNGGWLSRFFARLIEARELQARRLVNAHLRSLDNETLKSFGLEPAEIKRLRRGGSIELLAR